VLSRLCAEHADGTADHGDRLWLLMNLEMWQRIFIDGDDPQSLVSETGCGTRLKIFEALAMGKAAVSTSVGAEGLPLVAEQHFLAADDPAAFAQSVLKLLRDRKARERLGFAGRRLVEARYSWREVARRFESELSAGVNGRQAESESDVADERERHRDEVKGGVGQSCA
jgi:glycosyl transferase family 1